MPAAIAGRDDLRHELRFWLESGVPVHRALIGPRGIGKTVLLRDVDRWAAETHDWITVTHIVDSAQDVAHALSSLVIEQARRAAPLWERFATAITRRLSIGIDALIQISVAPPSTTPIASDRLLLASLEELGRAALDQHTAAVLLIDEIQSLEGRIDMVRLSQALQHVGSLGLPVHSIHAGLYLPASPAGGGGSFIERMQVIDVGLLDPTATRLAFVEPLAHAGIAIEPAALDLLVDRARGYPYFTQLYGEAAWSQWRRAGGSGPIRLAFARAGLAAARRQVDAMFSRRFDQLRPPARAFVVAMAEVTDRTTGIATIAAIAERLGRDQRSLSQTRQSLIERHQLIEPTSRRGELRFVLPEYDAWARSRGVDRLDDPV
jgi:hypothetical protein